MWRSEERLKNVEESIWAMITASWDRGNLLAFLSRLHLSAKNAPKRPPLTDVGLIAIKPSHHFSSFSRTMLWI